MKFQKKLQVSDQVHFQKKSQVSDQLTLVIFLTFFEKKLQRLDQVQIL